MSKLSFRARALDPSKPMPIFLAEELPDLPEYSAINRAVPQMPSGMEKEEESEHHLQRAICAGLLIPTPEVFSIDVESFDRNYPPNYKMPRQLIHMQPLGLEQDIPDYDMDSADEMWVNQQSRRLDLTALKFEHMMDRLEKSSGQTVVTLNEAKALLKQDDEISIAVYDYWLNKRLKTQHPLILSVKTENRPGASANNPYLAFRRRTEKMQTRKNRKNDETSYEKMLKLKRDLFRAVTLLDMVKRREKTKREQLHLSIEIFEKRYQAKDFSGSLLSELTSNVKNSRPAFAPLYPNQYSHHSSTSSATQSGGLLAQASSSSSHHYSTSTYLNPSSGLTPGGVVGMSSSTPSTGIGNSSRSSNKRELLDPSYIGGNMGNRKEKRQYKKRKHKLSREKQYSSIPKSSSPAAIESTMETEEDDIGGNHLGSEPEDEGLYAFKRNKNCEYHKPLTSAYGNWPWESKEDNGFGDTKYRFTLTSIRHPRPRCIGFARRRQGRGGRIIIDRISTNMDDLWSQLDYTIMDNCKPDLAKSSVETSISTSETIPNANRSNIKLEPIIDVIEIDDNISRDPLYISASTDKIPYPNLKINNNYHHPNNIIKNNLISEMDYYNNSITTNEELLTNKEIKSEIVDDLSGSEYKHTTNHNIVQHNNHHYNNDQEQILIQQQQDDKLLLSLSSIPTSSENDDNITEIVVDLIRTHCKNNSSNNGSYSSNNNLSNNNLNNRNYINSSGSNRTNNDINNVIKQEHIVKQEAIDSASDLNILDDENMNLARLSSFINANKINSQTNNNQQYQHNQQKNQTSNDNIRKNEHFKSSSPMNSFDHFNTKPNDLQKTFSVSEEIGEKNQENSNSPVDDNIINTTEDFIETIRKDWLHFRPKTPPPVDALNCSENTSSQLSSTVKFSEDTPISIEMQRLGSSPPSSVFDLLQGEDTLFATSPFSYCDLQPDEQLLAQTLSLPLNNGATQTHNHQTDSSSSGIDFNLSGDSLTELNLSLGEGEDNEKMLDNILQECQIDDLKALNQTTNFWNGLLDDGNGILDCIDEKKTGVSVIGGDINNKDGLDDAKKVNKRKSSANSLPCRIGSSKFSILNAKDEKDVFFQKPQIKTETNVDSIKTEPSDEIIISPPPPPPLQQIILPLTKSSQIKQEMIQKHTIPVTSTTSSISLNQSTLPPPINHQQKHIVTQAVTTQIINPQNNNLIPPHYNSHPTLITNLSQSTGTNNTNTPGLVTSGSQKFYIKHESGNQVPLNQNAVITLSNVKLENDLQRVTNAGLITTGHSGNLITDGGTPLIVTTPKQQQQHILLQQLGQGAQAQIINVSGATALTTDASGTFVLAETSPPKRQLNGPSDRNAIQNIFNRKIINRKYIQQQIGAGQIHLVKQEDDNSRSGSPKPNQSAGNFIKMSSYPVVVSDLNMPQQNSLSATVAANHNYSLQPSAQPITIIGQGSQQGNKIILSTSGGSSSNSNSGNFTIATPIQDLQNKIHYKEIPASNFKLNFVTSTGSLIVDTKNSDLVKTQTSHQATHSGGGGGGGGGSGAITLQQQQQPQQRIKLDKSLNMYIDSPESKRVLYTKLVNLGAIQHKNNSGQTVQVTPSTAQLLNKTHTVQRLGNTQAIFTNMRSIPVSSQIVSSPAGAGGNNGGVGNSGHSNVTNTATAVVTGVSDIAKQLNNINNSPTIIDSSSSSSERSSPTTATVSSINLNTTNR